jgi:hypothetical protein
MNSVNNILTSQSVLAGLQNYYGVDRFARWQTQDWCYYDNVYVPTAGTAELQFFAVQSGGADPNRPAATITKTDEQTNLPVSGQIGGAECFVPLSIHFDLYPAVKSRQQVSAVTTQTTFAADQLLAARWIQNMVNQGVFVWEINKNTWMEEALPFRRFPPGFGLGTVIPPTIGGVTAPINGGANAVAALSAFSIFEMGDIFTLDQPMFLAPTTPFTWKIKFPQGNSTATTNIYNGGGTAHDQTATFFAYAEMRGVKIRPEQ